MAPKHRAPTSAPRSFDQRLLAYALGGGTLALAGQHADAALISSGIQNVSVTSNGPSSNTSNAAQAHLNPLDNSSPQFQIQWTGNGAGGGLVNVRSFNSDLKLHLANPGVLTNFSAGTTVGPATPLPPSKYPKYDTLPSGAAVYDVNGSWIASAPSLSSSNWAAGATGYFGFSYVDGGSLTHYGWMELTVPTTSLAGPKATVVQWAYESDPNTPITIPSAAAVPEIDTASAAGAAALLLAGFSLLEQQVGFAAGAAGLRAWRKRRQALAA